MSASTSHTRTVASVADAAMVTLSSISFVSGLGRARRCFAASDCSVCASTVVSGGSATDERSQGAAGFMRHARVAARYACVAAVTWSAVGTVVGVEVADVVAGVLEVVDVLGGRAELLEHAPATRRLPAATTALD